MNFNISPKLNPNTDLILPFLKGQIDWKKYKDILPDITPDLEGVHGEIQLVYGKALACGRLEVRAYHDGTREVDSRQAGRSQVRIDKIGFAQVSPFHHRCKEARVGEIGLPKICVG